MGIMSVELLPPRPWERQDPDTDRSFEAFEVYRQMGTARSLAKVARKLGKSKRVIEAWSRRNQWAERVIAFDRYEAQKINDRIVADTARMRRRQIEQALELQGAARKRLRSLRPEEVERLSAYELCLLMRTGTEMENHVREMVPESQEFPTNLPPPRFEIQIISPGRDMIGVQLPTPEGIRYGYIRADMVEQFRKDHPDATVIA
jgi:hypothetical protein